MAEELPGFIPPGLRLDDVSLLRADETVFIAMVDGWRAQMLARGLAVDTIKVRCRLTDDAISPRRRAFSKAELQHIFDVVDSFVDEANRTGSKHWLTVLRSRPHSRSDALTGFGGV